MSALSAAEVIRLLDLEPLRGEGGYFRRTWTAPPFRADPKTGHHRARVAGSGRPAGSAIFFLLTGEEGGFSAFHRLGTDEVYHFYRGDPVELHLFLDDGSYERRILGPEFERGQSPQTLAPAGSVQGSRLAPGGTWALLGTTMAPAFDPGDFELVGRAGLRARHPEYAELIDGLTRA